MARLNQPQGDPEEVIEVFVIGDNASSATKSPELLHRNRYFQHQRQQREDGQKPDPTTKP